MKVVFYSLAPTSSTLDINDIQTMIRPALHA